MVPVIRAVNGKMPNYYYLIFFAHTLQRAERNDTSEIFMTVDEYFSKERKRRTNGMNRKRARRASKRANQWILSFPRFGLALAIFRIFQTSSTLNASIEEN